MHAKKFSESMRSKDAFPTFLSKLNKGKVLQCLILYGHYYSHLFWHKQKHKARNKPRQ